MRVTHDETGSWLRFGLAALALSILLLLATALWGCGDDDNAITNPAFQPQITNAVDNFQLQATDVKNVSQTVEYIWQNTGPAANVDQSCAITQGSAVIALIDGAGTQVYSRDLAEGGSFASSDGVAGNWKIRVTFVATFGTINFRVQKRD